MKYEAVGAIAAVHLALMRSKGRRAYPNRYELLRKQLLLYCDKLHDFGAFSFRPLNDAQAQLQMPGLKCISRYHMHSKREREQPSQGAPSCRISVRSRDYYKLDADKLLLLQLLLLLVLQ